MVSGSLDRMLAWTPAGLVRFGWKETLARPLPTPPILRELLTQVRQLSPYTVVALAGDSRRHHRQQPPVKRLVVFPVTDPGAVIDLGEATSWFSSHDGVGLWRVLQRSGGPITLDGSGVCETTHSTWPVTRQGRRSLSTVGVLRWRLQTPMPDFAVGQATSNDR